MIRRKWHLSVTLRPFVPYTEGRETARLFVGTDDFFTRFGAYKERNRLIIETERRDRYVSPERWVGPHLDFNVYCE